MKPAKVQININVDKKDSIIFGLYEILEKLRYPEIAETHLEDFKNTILVDTKRLDLLLWILKEDPSFNLTAFNKLNDTSLEAKLYKCYSQMGFVNNLECLLGSCSIEKQTVFLSLLTIYLKTVHLENNDKENSNQLLKKNLNSNNDCVKQVMYKNETSINEEEYSQFLEDLENEKINESCNPDKLNENILEKQKELSERKIDEYKTVLQSMHAAFKDVSHLPSQDIENNMFSEYFNNFGQDLKQIQAGFSNINKIITSENKIKSHSVPVNFIKLPRPLSQDIQNNLVLAEQACNILKKSLS